MPGFASSASPTGRRISPIPAIATSLSASGAWPLRAPLTRIRYLSRRIERDRAAPAANRTTRARDPACRLDAVAAPAHLHASDANTRSAFSSDQSRSCAMGSAGHPLVRARLYCRPCPGLADHSPDRLRRPLLGWKKASERRHHRRSARLLRLRRHHRRPARQCAVLRSAVLLLPSDRDFQSLGRRDGLSRRADRRADRRPPVQPSLQSAGVDRARPLRARRADWYLPWPNRQLHSP
jgi:hypothetical protein